MQYLQGPAFSWYSEYFAESVRAMTSGRINIEVFAADELVPTGEMMAMTGKGMIDGTTFGYGGYWSDEIDVGAIEGGLPGTFRNTWEIDWFFYEAGFRELCREAYAEHNVYFVTHLNADPYELFVNTKIESLDDLRKLKIRAVGATAEMFEGVGVSTEYIGFSELYTALATGVIDGQISGGAVECLGYKFYEAAPYLIFPRAMVTAVCDLLINMDVWNSLSDEDKSIIEVAAGEYNRYMTMMLQAGEVGALAELKTLGLEICELPPEDAAEMTAAASKVWDKQSEVSPRAAEAIRILKEWMVELGYLA
jgi:TRAP-type C4-dicarboxylate transport system substrate-binding protein